jgi:hypothetical protein
MTKTSEPGSVEKKAEAPPKATAFPTQPEFSPAVVNDLIAANTAVVEEFMAMNRAIGDFVGRRLRADMDIVSRLSGCRDWQQVLSVQTEFMGKLAEDYFAETSKLMEWAARMMETGPMRAGLKAEKKPKGK